MRFGKLCNLKVLMIQLLIPGVSFLIRIVYSVGRAAYGIGFRFWIEGAAAQPGQDHRS